ncbi:hypothetical protein IGI37_000682 [Enterococcus sp. AZ194]|uniref:DUF6176 family protein n=1 Tax=Enterococcus sp. AZ194 TaxID=2774629 RepID=UPI003F214B96
MLTTELTRFRVKKGMSQKVDEWLAFLNENMAETLLTLEKEKMYVETIFRETLDGDEYLYWYSIQGEDGQEVEASDHWIDKKHLEYWALCIDRDFRPVDLTPEVVMIPKNIRDHMS